MTTTHPRLVKCRVCNTDNARPPAGATRVYCVICRQKRPFR